MIQKGVKKCSAGFQPAEGSLQLQTKNLFTPHPQAGKMPALRFLRSFSDSARRFAAETS
jgi:hypothetical protein